jgi:hypothetical protein
MNTTAPTTRREARELAAFRPLPTPLERIKAAGRELRSLPEEYARLSPAVPAPWEAAERIVADAARVGTSILEQAELVGIELGEVASHSHRYAADRDAALHALGNIRHLIETISERHSSVTLSRIEGLLDEAGVQ